MAIGEHRPDTVRIPEPDDLNRIKNLSEATTEELVAERNRLSDIEIIPYSKERETKIRGRIDQIQLEITGRVFNKKK